MGKFLVGVVFVGSIDICVMWNHKTIQTYVYNKLKKKTCVALKRQKI